MFIFAFLLYVCLFILGYVSKMEHLSSVNEVAKEFENYLVGLEVTHILTTMLPKKVSS